jgi:hypothetical protein
MYVKWHCAVIVNGTSVTGVLTVPESLFTVSFVLFFCGSRLVVVSAIMKAEYTAVGGRVAKLVS